MEQWEMEQREMEVKFRAVSDRDFGRCVGYCFQSSSRCPKTPVGARHLPSPTHITNCHHGPCSR